MSFGLGGDAAFGLSLKWPPARERAAVVLRPEAQAKFEFPQPLTFALEVGHASAAILGGAAERERVRRLHHGRGDDRAARK